MPFQFPLSSLLRLRQSVEKTELQRLQRIAAQVAQVRREIESLDIEEETARQQLVEQASVGISGAELHIAALGEEARRSRRLALLARLGELEQERSEQHTRYNRARQQREILSNLRQRHFLIYQAEQARREQQQIDELFVIRRSNRWGSNRIPKEGLAQ